MGCKIAPRPAQNGTRRDQQKMHVFKIILTSFGNRFGAHFRTPHRPDLPTATSDSLRSCFRLHFFVRRWPPEPSQEALIGKLPPSLVILCNLSSSWVILGPLLSLWTQLGPLPRRPKSLRSYRWRCFRAFSKPNKKESIARSASFLFPTRPPRGEREIRASQESPKTPPKIFPRAPESGPRPLM